MTAVHSRKLTALARISFRKTVIFPLAAEKLLALAVLVIALNAVCFACGGLGILAIGEEADWKGLLRYHGALLLMQLETGGLCFGASSPGYCRTPCHKTP